jgi:small GTP-binding protein
VFLFLRKGKSVFTAFVLSQDLYICQACLVEMGAVLDKLEEWWNTFQKETCVLVLGLDNAGKTAALYALKLDEPVEYTIPTIGFNIETIQMGPLSIQTWDLGGQTKLRALWPHYYEQADGIVFVVDSNDRGRVPLAREELQALMAQKELASVPFLILANKQDLPQALRREELITELGLHQVTTTPWHVIECTATKNERVKVGFEWLISVLN